MRKIVASCFVLLLVGCGSTLRLPSDEERRLNDEISLILKNNAGAYYTVQSGDTLWAIAKKHNTDVDTIVRLNPETLKGSTHTPLVTGQTLVVPAAQVNNGSPEDLIPSDSGFIWPVRGQVLNNLGKSGINIKSQQGVDVRAVKSGRVIQTLEKMEGYGKVIIIKHADGFSSLYGYNSEILVKDGQTVKQGDVVAKVGQTGRAGQPQLHFRLFKDNEPVNPLNYLP
ncbi:MAG: peptidoglycan DD-metalloendopeptidase family protein [Planctomycetes bacterium]|nr:peptidoglycan DD-metalloendopeptidase family protein [Planctomycetota bacterium]